MIPTWDNFTDGDICLRCKKSIIWEHIGIWTLKDGTEFIMHDDCVIDAWIDNEDIETLYRKEAKC